MYKGKEVCQGCKKTGIEVPRWDKDGLCESCKGFIKIGRSVNVENLTEYVKIRDWVNGFASFDFDDNSLNHFANVVLEAINNPDAPTKGEIGLRENPGHSNVFYTVPKAFAVPLVEFLRNLEKVIISVKKEKQEIREQAKNAVRDEKNSIFNLGVEHGRDLLNQLNRGEITIDDFNKTVIKY